MKPIVITPGDPGGIGPDLCIQAAVDGDLHGVVVADPNLLSQRAKLLKAAIVIEAASAYNPKASPGVLYVDPICAGDASNPPGISMPENADYCLQCLNHAITQIQANKYSALVTGPVNKAMIRDGGFSNFTGHTEYLRDYFGCEKVVMLLCSSEVRVALVTTHLPLREVPGAITKALIIDSAKIVIDSFQRYFRISEPRLHVLGLNPHAGESGHLGEEDGTIIRPAIEQLRVDHPKLLISGPLAADTAFSPQLRKQADVTIAMYHDQGLPVVKYLGIGDAVNITLGLPIIRTSVDHGTALELAGRGIASTNGLTAAMREAIKLGFPSKPQ